MVRLFANGTEFMVWDERNCAVCKKGYTDECELQDAIDLAALTDGEVPKDIAERLGYFDRESVRHMFYCREREVG